MSLKQLSEHVYYLAAAVNTFIISNKGQAILIDTGQDKDYGRKLKQACEALDLQPIAILNTHSHADHYGGNDYLLKHYAIPVYAPVFEASILQAPYLEPVYLFNGAKPLPELLSKWLLAKPSKVDAELKEGKLELAGLELTILETSGHAHRHMSVICDDVLIAADALFGYSVLEKYALPFGQDIAKQIASTQKLSGLDVRVTVPGHGDPSEDLADLVSTNLRAFSKASEAILQACNGKSTEEVLRQSCQDLGIIMTDLPRYYLNLCVVMAYLSYLRESAKVALELKSNSLYWSKTP